MIYENEIHDEERSFYGIKDAIVRNCKIDGPADGESAFKECKNITVEDTFLNLRYPFWHDSHVKITACEMTEGCRAALWYDKDVEIDRCKMHGIKALRECEDITLTNTDVISPEFAWRSRNIKIKNVTTEGEYPFFECKKMDVDELKMKGKYSFQYVENVTLKNCILDTKDAFWHAKNVTIEDSVVKGEYLAWYAKGIKLVNCQIIGTQPICYSDNIVLENCTMENTDFSFEYSTVDAKINGNIMSIKNPYKGNIIADSIDEIIIDEFAKQDSDVVINGKKVA